MYEQFPELMNMLWSRMLKDNKKNWRRVYKVWVLVCIYYLTCKTHEILKCTYISDYDGH